MTDAAVQPVRTAGRGPFAELIAAVAFLTRVPVGARAVASDRTGAAAFGLVGAFLGAVAAVPLLVAGTDHPLPASIAAVAILALLDGGLHLDGLADTFDALAAPAGAADRARTDPRAGTAGVVAIVLTLGIEAAALAELAPNALPYLASASLVAAATLSRALAPVWAVTIGRRRRSVDGLGVWFAEHVSPRAAAFAVLTAILITLLLVEFVGPRIVLAALAGVVGSVVIGGLLIRARGQLDGDGYGAIIETTLATILLAAVVLG